MKKNIKHILFQSLFKEFESLLQRYTNGINIEIPFLNFYPQKNMAINFDSYICLYIFVSI
jgi:hypothetical protein